jgi:transcription antitermination factor NusG
MLPLKGDVLVKQGQRVDARDVVARAAMPGDVTPINLANALSLPPSDVPECLLKKEGDTIAAGDVIARTKGIFGFFKSEYKSKTAGTLESVSKVTGQLMIRGEPIPIEVRAYLAGEVVEVIPGEGAVVESETSLIQGIFGVGGEAYGPIRMACDNAAQELSAGRITAGMKGAVVVGGARMTGEAVHRAVSVGAAAILSGGIDDQDLRDILGYDLGVAVTGSETIGITLIVTEGFGEIAMADQTFALLSSREGAEAAVNGTTQIRAGVVRPEILIPIAEDHKPAGDEARAGGTLEVGASVRIIRDPYFGTIGTVAALPPEPARLESESKARVVEVQVRADKTVTVPRANVELVNLES